MGWLEDLGIWGPLIIVIGYYALFSLGLQLQVGHAGLDNFGQVGFAAIGAYAYTLSAETWGKPLWMSIAIALGVAALAAALVSVPTIRLRGDFLAITAIAAGEIVRNVAQNSVITGGPKGLTTDAFRVEVTRPLRRWLEDMLGTDVDRVLPLLLIVWATVLGGALLLTLLLRTPWGRVLRAVREDEDSARAIGKNAFLYKLQAMVIGAIFAALAGVFFAINQVQFSPSSFEPIFTFTGFVIIIIAGLGSIWGTLIAAVIVRLLLEGTRYLDLGLPNEKEAALRFIIVGLVLMLIVAFRPQGIFGKRQEMVLDE